MKRYRWYVIFGLFLVVTSALLYLLHYAVFRNAHHIYIYLLGDIAFLPLEVLLVTLIVDRLLNERDKRATLEKLNMVIGAFFSEVGTELLRLFCSFDPGVEDKRKALTVTGDLREDDFPGMEKALMGYEFKIDSRAGDLASLKDLIVGKRDFMVRLLENPLLLEHESFTSLLWAVFHLTEELDSRPDPSRLPGADLDHLAGDMSRAYGLLASRWLDYMWHLKASYPYLFSLAVRLNPFDPQASAEIR